MIAKAGLGLVGLSAISIGGVAVAKPHWLGMDYMPSFHFLSEDNGFSTGYDNKFGKTYKNYLVGVTHKGGQTKETNKAWWEWSFRRLEKTRHGKFKGVTKEYGDNSTTDLNKVCEDAYKQTTSVLKSNGEATIQDTEFKKSDVWKYCSPGLLTHTNEDKDKYTDQKIGGKTDNKDLLISVEDSSNDWFWNQRNKDFWSQDTTNNEWSGSKATGDNGNESIFKKEYKANKDGTNKPKIKDLCKKVYDSEATNDETDAKKFCVLEVATQ